MNFNKFKKIYIPKYVIYGIPLIIPFFNVFIRKIGNGIAVTFELKKRRIIRNTTKTKSQTNNTLNLIFYSFYRIFKYYKAIR